LAKAEVEQTIVTMDAIAKEDKTFIWSKKEK
jgi:hypothetical protein